MKFNLSDFKQYLLDNPSYTTEDMELILRALMDWKHNQKEFYRERKEV